MTQPTQEQIEKFWERCGFKKVVRNVPQSRGGSCSGCQMPPRACENCEVNKLRKAYYLKEERWTFPEPRNIYGKRDYHRTSELPTLDLDNLFRWAVPKVTHAEVSTGCFAGQTGKYRAQVKINPPQLYERWSSASDYTPALALFWAIWKVMEA